MYNLVKLLLILKQNESAMSQEKNTKKYFRMYLNKIANIYNKQKIFVSTVFVFVKELR